MMQNEMKMWPSQLHKTNIVDVHLEKVLQLIP